MKEIISWNDFEKIDIRVGTIIEVKIFEKAKNPAYQLWIDFGELGILKSSAQITKCYSQTEILFKQVMAVVNFPEKQIANFMSQCLVLGVVGNDKDVVLIEPERKVTNGFKIG
ncbi:tRNA-binding protein [Flavobacterium sp. I3-2]|uniref:tRNA-binding protein n=1 Tax=Flavobacterium sp. I3-2 TaxID=2748319 RepID=UPI0015AD1474|nr:tRNA-binding protein [Flavobacterium sp. I3-2]